MQSNTYGLIPDQNVLLDKHIGSEKHKTLFLDRFTSRTIQKYKKTINFKNLNRIGSLEKRVSSSQPYIYVTNLQCLANLVTLYRDWLPIPSSEWLKRVLLWIYIIVPVKTVQKSSTGLFLAVQRRSLLFLKYYVSSSCWEV